MKIQRTINLIKLKKFLTQIKEKDFLKIKKINNEIWRNYGSKKKFFFYFVLNKEKEYVATMIILNTSYSNHIFLLYVLKSHRSKGIGKKLVKIFFQINKGKLKTVHLKKNLKRAIKFYIKNNFTIKLDKKDNSLQKWIKRCQTKNKHHFKTRVLLYKN